MVQVQMVTDIVKGNAALEVAPSDAVSFHVDFRDKGTQDVYVGREQEQERLLTHLQGIMEDGEEQVKGVALIAPPGAGKSTLLTKTLAAAASRGIKAVQIGHEDLAASEDFSRAVQNIEPWKSWYGENGVWTKLVNATAKGLDSGLGTALGMAGSLMGGQVDKSNVDLCEQIIAGWRQNSTPSAVTVLQAIDRASPKGFVLAIDEAQQLRRHLSGDPKCCTSVLNILGDPDRRQAAGIRRSTIVLAGLSDTADVLAEFGSLRQMIIRLEPLDQKAVMELVQHRIRRSGVTHETAAAATQFWAPRLVADYGGWTHHAQCAAYATEKLLEKFESQILEVEWGWPLLVREVSNGIADLYELVENRANDAVGSTVVQTIAHAIRRNGSFLSEDVLLDLIAATERLTESEREHDTAKQRRRRGRDTIIDLLHAGMLERTHRHKAERSMVPAVTPQAGYYVPIPSVLRHLTRMPPTAAMLQNMEQVGVTGEPN